jgi:hypothetical protein
MSWDLVSGGLAEIYRLLGKPYTLIFRIEAALYYHEDQGRSLGDNPLLVPLLPPEILHRMSYY